MKLYVIDTLDNGEWTSRYLHKGVYRLIVQEAETKIGDPDWVRVRRVKSQMEADRYIHRGLHSTGCSFPETEWVK